MDLKRIFENKKYLAAAIIILLLLLIGSLLSMEIKLISFFLIFILICGAFSYTQAMVQVPIDFSPTFFFTIIIATRYGPLYALLFIPLAGWFPALLSGGQWGPAAIFFMSSWVLLGFLANVFIGYGIIAVGIVAAILNLLIGWFINSFMGSEGGFYFSIINAVMSIFYFIMFGTIVYNLLA